VQLPKLANRSALPSGPTSTLIELWLVRHGETQWNIDGRVQGHQDIPLSPRGVGQAFRVAERLAASRLPFEGLYASDLERARETAAPIATVLGLGLRIDPRLREINSGLLQGHLKDELPRFFPEYLAAVQQDPWQTARPEGESMAQVAQRLASFVAELHPGRHLLITHGGVIRAALKQVLQMQDQTWRRFNIANASITRLGLDCGVGQAYSVGDTAHLEVWADALMDDT
jgi:probable phosphoglycerate mutase